MFQNSQIPYLWDHSLTGEIISISFDNHRQFNVSITTQVLKLASRFALQNSKGEVSCLLVASCDTNNSMFQINIDRIECNLTSYLSDNQLFCSNDICIPFKIFKNKTEATYSLDEYISSYKEYTKVFEDHSSTFSLSSSIFMKAYAGFVSEHTQAANAKTTLSWIDLHLVVPDLHMTLSPINRIPMFRSALISSFENNAFSSTFTFGYLSIDQASKVHFLLHSDERAYSSPIVGIWVHGVSDVSDTLVVSACMKYIVIKDQDNKLCKPPLSFLLAVFSGHSRDSISFYDVRWPKASSSADSTSPFNNVGFKLLSATSNLDRYYQPPNEKAASFLVTLSPDVGGNSGLEVINRAFRTFVTENMPRNYKDDTVPRAIECSRSTFHPGITDQFRCLEVSDVSLLANETSKCSSVIAQGPNQRKAYLVSTVDCGEDRPAPSTNASLTNNQSDEAIPRPFLRKPQQVSSLQQNISRHDIPEPHYQQVQFIPQPMFTYPAMYPHNPYMMFPPNMYMQTCQDMNAPVISKPPPRPKQTEPTQNKIKDVSNRKEQRQPQIKKAVEKNPPNGSCRVDRAVITDITNTSSKRVLQLDREEDLATLEVLVQQIITQRHNARPTMVSKGVNTTEVIFADSFPKTIEVSTDPPSFITRPLCAQCRRALIDGEGDRDTEEVYCKENSLVSNRSLNCSKSNEMCENANFRNEEEHVSNEPFDESMHYSDLLTNLEEFVKQSKNIATEQHVREVPEETVYEEEQSKLNMLEEAVQNLRDLDVSEDAEGQYLCSLRNQAPGRDDLFDGSRKFDNRDSLDVTILQQKINYVSVLLNSSTISPGSIGSRQSLNEQSMLIESLARKYLHKAASKLEKMGLSGAAGVDDTCYFSSIRLPGGQPLPATKVAVSSTPAPHCTQALLGCRRERLPAPGGDSGDWSGPRILEGLDQHPPSMPPASRLASGLSSDMVLDVERLRLLPKYL